VISFMLLPLYPQENFPRSPLDGRLGGPQIPSGRCGEERNLALPGIEPMIEHCSVGNAVSGTCRDKLLLSCNIDFKLVVCSFKLRLLTESNRQSHTFLW
jgi:hypothetical protein